MKMSHGHLRLFIAISVHGQTGALLASEASRLQAELPFRRWTHPADYHLTLQFLGDTPAGAVQSIVLALNGVASALSPFPLAIEKLGCFGSPQAPKTLYVGAGGDIASLSRLQSAVTEAMEPLGFAKEKRPYRPHVTLARNYAGSEPLPDGLLASLSSGMKPLDLPVRHIVLYESRLGQRPMYEPVAEVPLGTPAVK
jgi:2'-5' RNA ligase